MNIWIIIGPWVPILIVVVIGVGVIGFFKLKNGGSANEEEGSKKIYGYKRKQFFMSNAEHECYKALVQAVGNEYFVFAQVHLPTIVDEKINGQDWRASRAHINRKSVDFVLCDKEYISPKLAIELDDWSHERADRQDRDREVERILEQAGMPLLRITDTQNLAEKISQKLNPAKI